MNGTARNADFQKRARDIERSIEDEKYADARASLHRLHDEYGGLPEVLRLEESLEWFHPTEKADEPSEGHGSAE